MRTLKLVVLACVISLVGWSIMPFTVVEGQNTTTGTNGEVLSGNTDDAVPVTNALAEEAQTGFDNEPLPGGPVDPNFPDFAENLATFDGLETADDGVGPVFNGRSCGECHSNPVIGGSSQVLEVRAGRLNGNLFVDHQGDSLIHSRTIDPAIQEYIIDGNNVRTSRGSLQLFGLGLVEAIDDNVLLNNFNREPALSRRFGGNVSGLMINVPVEEAPGQVRVGRFGWKNQNATILTFAGDAYTNEMGITTPLFPIENTSNGKSVLEYDHVPAGCVMPSCNPVTTPDEPDNEDIEIFSAFIRALKPPPRDRTLVGTPAVVRGEQLFGTSLGNSVGCSICHTATFTTAPTGTSFANGSFVVPPALGNKIIHPYSDFALHDIGTGDGIVQNGGQQTRNMVRTVPLWGLRTRNRFFHDGQLLTLTEVIRAHRNEAQFAATRFNSLSTADRNAVIAFLRSL